MESQKKNDFDALYAQFKIYVSLPKVKAIIQTTKMTLPIDKTIPVPLWSIDKIEVNCGL